MAKLSALSLSEYGTYMYAGFDFEYTNDGDSPKIRVRPDGVSDEDALVLDVDGEFVRSIEEIFEKFRLEKWDGFNKSDDNVLDGNSFSFSAQIDGKRISAGGYMKYPSGYGDAKGRLFGLFMDRYEQVRPDRLKVMKAYFEDVILKDTPRLEKQEISFGYISAGGNMFRLGKCQCSGGAHMSVVYSYIGEPEYMLVTYLTENDEGWVLSCRLFKITESGEVLPWGEVEIDPCFFNSDRLYAYIFTKQHDEKIILGCFTQKSFSASGRESLFYIDLYDCDNKLEPLANEKVTGPREREKWNMDMLSNFVEVADKYGFPQSKAYWQEHPYDPVFASGIQDNTNHRMDFNCSNNHDGNFYQTLLSTKEGEEVGEYRVKGKIFTN